MLAKTPLGRTCLTTHMDSHLYSKSIHNFFFICSVSSWKSLMTCSAYSPASTLSVLPALPSQRLLPSNFVPASTALVQNPRSTHSLVSPSRATSQQVIVLGLPHPNPGIPWFSLLSAPSLLMHTWLWAVLHFLRHFVLKNPVLYYQVSRSSVSGF